MNKLTTLYIRLRRELMDPLAWYLSFRELQSTFACSLVPDIVEATFQYMGRGYYARIRPSQIREEVTSLAEMLKDKQPRTIVEIGTRKGGTLFIWSRVVPSAQTIVSVDLPGGIHGGGYHPRRKKLYRAFVADRPGTNMTLFQANSQTVSTRDAVTEALGQKAIDFLFIDGDHRYEGVRSDFELYSPLVGSGGIIAFHDIIPQRFHEEYGVSRLWNEIKDEHEHVEIVQDPQQGRMGIGVLVKR